MCTTVVNKHWHIPCEEDVYIGRGSKWGNPFRVTDLIDNETACRLYAEHLVDNKKLLKDLPELRGKNLVCYCAPKMCHGDVLVIFLETLYPSQRTGNES